MKRIVLLVSFLVIIFLVFSFGTVLAETASDDENSDLYASLKEKAYGAATAENSLKNQIYSRVQSLLDDDAYWKAELTDVSVNPDGSSNDPYAKIVNIYSKWDAMNGPDRAKIILEMFSDDIAFTICEAFPDEKINQIWCFWEVPYIIDVGYAAKYHYELKVDGLYRIEEMGPIYGWD